jgi:Flp pilus assembly protein CpaB
VIITIPRTLTDGSTDWLTATLLQSTRVIAVDDVVAPGPAGVSLAALDGEQLASRLVTLEVGPTEVRQLVHASERGRIHLALRSPANLDFYPYEQQSLNTNTFVDVPAADQARRIAQSRQGESLSRTSERTKAVIQLFKGSKESSFSMDQGGGR